LARQHGLTYDNGSSRSALSAGCRWTGSIALPQPQARDLSLCRHVLFCLFVFCAAAARLLRIFFFHRPAGFVPALFFLAALAGYLHKGQWRTNQIEHWLVLALVVSVVSQIAFMPLSEQLFDPMFDAAHLLKKTSYVLVLVGLVISIYQLHKNEVEHALQLQRANEGLQSEARLRQAESAVRELIANMTSPEDLGVVLDGLRLQLQRLGVEHDSLSLQIFNEDGDDFVSIFSNKKHGIAQFGRSS
jgi:hypothetical protein